MKMLPGLYIVSTPIGNLGDITLRAISTLKNSHIILCEDSRVSRKLLAKHDIRTKLQVYNDHSDAKDREDIIALIRSGNIISLVSDAGTPIISDPGYKLVKAVRVNNLHIEAVPGVSAPITALSLSALPSDKFMFCGFLPRTHQARKNFLQEHIDIRATLIFFETASRLMDSLLSIKEILGNREVCVARELTKLYQEVKNGSVAEIIEFYQQNPLKGEIVLLVSGYTYNLSDDMVRSNLVNFIELLIREHVSGKTIANVAYQQFKDVYSKNEIYKMVHQIGSERTEKGFKMT